MLDLGPTSDRMTAVASSTPHDLAGLNVQDANRPDTGSGRPSDRVGGVEILIRDDPDPNPGKEAEVR